jgi:hypothetical protein
MRWERFGADWIEMQFRSKMDNVFILEKTDYITRLYLFDDGPEIPTVSVTFSGEMDATMRAGIEERMKNGASEQEICEFLFDYFPEYRDYWKKEHGAL